MKKSVLALFLLFGFYIVHSQTIRSNGAGGGAWNDPSTWLGGVVPYYANSTAIIVSSGDIVTVPNGYGVTTDQLRIEANATLAVSAGGTLGVINGTNTDLVFANTTTARLQVAGLLIFTHNVLTNGVTSNTTILNGGVYRHAYANGGKVIPAVWDDGSTLQFTSFTSGFANPTNLGQNFFNVEWNCPSMTTYKNLVGLTTVRGDFRVLSTGSNVLRIFDVTSSRTLNIGGNFIVTGNSSVNVTDSGTGNVVNIGGTMSLSSAGRVLLARIGTVTMNVAGDLTHSVGALYFVGASGARAVLNLSSNFTSNAGIASLNGGIGTIRFVGGNQIFTRQTGITGTVDFIVESGSSLDLNSSFVSGGGFFILRTGATAVVRAVAGNGSDGLGAIQNNTIQGNIRVLAGRRIYEAGSTVIYAAASAQQIGNGHPATANTILDNPSGITVVANITARQVTLQQGTLNTGIYNVTLTGDWIVNAGLLNPGTGQLIFNGASNLLGPGTKNFGNVIVQDLAQLNVPDETVSVAGNFIVAPTAVVAANQSTIAFGGPNDQTLSANNNIFNNITINKTSGGLTLASNLPLRGLLSIQSSTILSSNGFLTLLSTADKPAVDATIGALPAGAAIVGDVTVQRYMGAVGKAWRFISSPVQNTPLADLKDDFKIAGNSFRWYDPLLINKPKNERFRTVPANSTTYILEVGRGYTPYMWEDQIVNLDFTGPINSGPISMPVAFGVSSPPMPDGDGWNLLGNPYPSAISWNGGPGWNRANLAPTVGIEESGANVWHYYNFLDGSGDIPNGFIATGQGFWVYANAPNPVLQINEQAKTNAKGGSFYREKAPEISKQLILVLEGNQGSRKAFLKLNPAATPEFDADLDAYPLPFIAMQDMNIELVDRNGAALLMHTLPELVEEEIPVNVIVPEAGEYSISFVNDGQFPLGGGLYLHDRFHGISTAVSNNTPYSFSASQAGAILDRFYLSTSPGMERQLHDMISVYPNPFTSQLVIEVASSESVVSEILDVTGKQVSTQEFSGRTEVETASLTAGVYFAKIRTTQGVVIRRILKR